MKITESIKEALKGASSPLAKLYNANMEVQVNVAIDNGQPLKNKQYTDGKETWFNIRIPYNAKSNPSFIDKETSFSVKAHAEAIGMTGWDWINRESLWVGYDIDSIVNHNEGLTEEQLNEIMNHCYQSKLVNLYRSTSGKGLHLYVFFDQPIKTENHREHSLLAKSLLSPLSIELGFNLQGSVDCLGSILWVWSRKQGSKGLQPLIEGGKFPSELIPKDWKQVKLSYVTPQVQKILAGLKYAALDDEHRRVLQWFKSKAKHDWRWDNEHCMLVGHTCDFLSCHRQLELTGIFETISQGKNPDYNCFAFPLSNGAWTIRRFGINTKEHSTWTTDKSGWTKCNFNQQATFIEELKSKGGLENKQGEVCFTELEKANEIITTLTNLPSSIQGVEQIKFAKKENKIVISVPTNQKIEGFIPNGKNQEKIIYQKEDRETNITETVMPDDTIRFVISASSRNSPEGGWFLYIRDQWIPYTKSDVLTVLATIMDSTKRMEKELFMGACLLDPFLIVNRPFEPEYPGGRLWNKDAIAYACQPVKGNCPSWNSLLNHLGESLNLSVRDNQWCNSNGLLTGGDYLKYWLAYIFQRPTTKLPYLFMYSEAQKTGKSTFQEAIRLLLKDGRGVVLADNALKGSINYNDELAGAIIAAVEETNLGKDQGAYNKIKSWVTGQTIAINTKYKSVYEITNTLHFVQTANDASYCPIFPNDSRITVIEVGNLVNEIPKDKFLSFLKDEVPYFLNELLSVDLPIHDSRLAMPVLESDSKRMIINSNRNMFQQFFDEMIIKHYGNIIPLSSLHSKFRIWLMKESPMEVDTWDKAKIIKSLPLSKDFPKGQWEKEIAIGNIAWKNDVLTESKNKIINKDGFLICSTL